MALLPYLINDMLDDYRRPVVGDLFDQNFGLGLWPNDSFIPTSSLVSAPLRCGYLRPWRSMMAADSGVSSIISNDKEFKVNLDVQQFKPEEIKVKLDEEGYVVVEGKHEERSDQHGFVSRQFSRRYKLPEDVQKEALTSNLSSDGVLSVQAPKRAIKGPAARDIKITRTDKRAVKASTEKKKNRDGESMEE